MSENEIGVEEARKVLGRLVDDAALSGVTTYLTRRGRRYAAIAPLKESAMSATRPFGTLIDATTGEEIGPATKAQLEASDEAGETGIFAVDRDLDPCDESADPKVFGPLRTVYVQA